MSRLHLVSWNVAGWRTALDEITRTTRRGPAATTKKVEEKQACVATWLERLDADIICLQETKLTSKQVEQALELYARPRTATRGSRSGRATTARRGSAPV